MKKLSALFIILIIAALCVSCGVGGPSEIDKGPHEHEFGEWYTVKAATCLTPGLDERSCECGEKQQKETVADSHTYVDTVVPSTCISKGYTEHKCECGSIFVDSFTDLGEHTYEYVIEREPTPTSTGWKYKQCTVCGKKGPRIEMYYDEFVTDDEEPGVTPPADDTTEPTEPTEPSHDECTAGNWFAQLINQIVNFFRKLLGKPEICYCGKEK